MQNFYKHNVFCNVEASLQIWIFLVAHFRALETQCVVNCANAYADATNLSTKSINAHTKMHKNIHRNIHNMMRWRSVRPTRWGIKVTKPIDETKRYGNSSEEIAMSSSRFSPLLSVDKIGPYGLHEKLSFSKLFFGMRIGGGLTCAFLVWRKVENTLCFLPAHWNMKVGVHVEELEEKTNQIEVRGTNQLGCKGFHNTIWVACFLTPRVFQHDFLQNIIKCVLWSTLCIND